MQKVARVLCFLHAIIFFLDTNQNYSKLVVESQVHTIYSLNSIFALFSCIFCTVALLAVTPLTVRRATAAAAA